MPIVIDPPEAPPLAPPSDEGSQLWEVLYAAMGYLRDEDPENDYSLQRLCEAFCAPIQRPYDLTRERDDLYGAPFFLDPDNCPAEHLPYLVQWVGGRLLPVMSEEQRRAEIKQPTAWRRGQLPAITLVTQRYLTGSKWVRIRPRTPEAGRIYIRTLLGETPNPDRLETELRAEAIPAWEILDYEAIDGVSWADIAASWEDWAALAGDFASWEEVAEMLPDELPEP